MYIFVYTKLTIMKTRKEQEKQVRKLINIIEDRIIDIMCLKGGFIMSSDLLRKVLKEFPELSDEWNTLRNRKWKLERKLWEVA